MSTPLAEVSMPVTVETSPSEQGLSDVSGALTSLQQLTHVDVLCLGRIVGPGHVILDEALPLAGDGDDGCCPSPSSSLENFLHPFEATGDRKLDPAEHALHSRGLKYNIGTRPNVGQLTCAVEQAVRLVEPSLRDEARSRAIGVVSKVARTNPTTLPAAETSALKRLQENENIVILAADKGNATVVLDRVDYINKINGLLMDTSTYAKLAKDPTKKVESELQKLLTEVFKFVPPERKNLYYRLLCHNGSAPALYGLPKIHKPDVPVRPIVDYTRSPLYELSGYLHRILRPLAGLTPTFVKDSAHFIELISSTCIDDDEVMISFDVKSMFTCVPIEYAVECCRKLLEADSSLPERTPLESHDICRLLKFCLENTYFVFNKQYYKQVFGTAMGASVSVVCANIALEDLESAALSSFGTRPKLFLRYVDDCFCIIPRRHAAHFLEHLNSFKPSIQFTAEEENNGRIPFVDVLVERTSGGLKTSVYRKPTHTGKYLSYDSAHPIGQKRSVAAALFSRAFRVCSSPTKRRQELQVVKRDLLSNGYPRQLLRTQERKAAKPRRETAKETGKRAAVPYTVGTSEALARIFKGYGVQIAHVPSRKLGQQLVRAKDPLQHADYPGVIYKIPCKECDVSVPVSLHEEAKYTDGGHHRDGASSGSQSNF
nr:uncharacterized protein LOC129383853 [Dermacentor andersoni]